MIDKLNEFQKLKKISNRLKHDLEIPSKMREKYLILDVELELINESVEELKKSMVIYRISGSVIHRAVYRELKELKKLLPMNFKK